MSTTDYCCKTGLQLARALHGEENVLRSHARRLSRLKYGPTPQQLNELHDKQSFVESIKREIRRHQCLDSDVAR